MYFGALEEHRAAGDLARVGHYYPGEKMAARKKMRCSARAECSAGGPGDRRPTLVLVVLSS